MTEHRDLLYYVDRLRAPYRDVVVQENEQRVRCVNHVERDGLLKQLRDAVVSGIGRRGAGTLGEFRLPFDAGALALYERLEQEIGALFYELTRQPVHLDLEKTLTGWYDVHTEAVRKGRLTLADDDAAFARARGWVLAVEGLFDPPRVLLLTVPRGEVVREKPRTVHTYDGPVEHVDVVRSGTPVPAPCPACEQRFGFDPGTGDRVYALRVEVRGERLQAVCRSCGEVWEGEEQVRDLVADIDVTDRKLEAEATQEVKQ